jgi:hypothetical protein
MSVPRFVLDLFHQADMPNQIAATLLKNAKMQQEGVGGEEGGGEGGDICTRSKRYHIPKCHRGLTGAMS